MRPIFQIQQGHMFRVQVVNRNLSSCVWMPPPSCQTMSTCLSQVGRGLTKCHLMVSPCEKKQIDSIYLLACCCVQLVDDGRHERWSNKFVRVPCTSQRQNVMHPLGCSTQFVSASHCASSVGYPQRSFMTMDNSFRTRDLCTQTVLPNLFLRQTH